MAQSTYADFAQRMAETRAAHLKNIDMTGKKILGIYTQAARELARQAAAAKEGTLTERWLTDYQRAMTRRIETMRTELGSAIVGGMRTSARLPGEAVEGWLDDALRMIGVDGSFSGVLSQTPDAPLRALLDGRMYRDGKSLSRRIWDRTDQLQGHIEDILTQGIAQHRSALQIAQDLEAYVRPGARMPVSWLTLYPDIPFDRQIDYNAQRLARTAINHAYWAANMDAAQRNPFCKAIHWQLSPSHYERQVARFGEDVCYTYASHDEGLGRGNWPIAKVPMPHAQCLCATWQVVPELDEVADRLGAWVDGGEDEALDRAFAEWGKTKGLVRNQHARYNNSRDSLIPPPMDLQLFAKDGEKDLRRQTPAQIRKGIASLQARVELHKEKIAHPAEYDKGWAYKDETQRNGLLGHWAKEIRTLEQNIENRKRELRKRGVDIE